MLGNDKHQTLERKAMLKRKHDCRPPFSPGCGLALRPPLRWDARVTGNRTGTRVRAVLACWTACIPWLITSTRTGQVFWHFYCRDGEGVKKYKVQNGSNFFKQQLALGTPLPWKKQISRVKQRFLLA